MRPSSIILFERSYLASVVLGALGGIWAWLHWTDMTDMMSGGTPPQVAKMMPVVMACGVIFSLIVDLLLWFFIARRGSEVAKWIYIVLFGIAVVGVLRSLFGDYGGMPELVKIVSLLRVLIEAACVWLLFRADAALWFKAGDRAPRDLHDTFS